MTIRSAAPEDAATLTTIALEAKRYWGYPEHWIKHWQSDLTISSGYIHDNHVYVAEENGEIRGFYALVCVTGNKAELDHMWVKPEAIGTGIGKELFLHAMESAAKLKVDAVEINSDPNAAGFYKRMGATQIGEVDSPVDGQDRKLPHLKINP